MEGGGVKENQWVGKRRHGGNKYMMRGTKMRPDGYTKDRRWKTNSSVTGVFSQHIVISIRSNTQTFSTLKGSENMHMVWSLLPVIMSNDSPQHVDMLSMLRSVSGPESVQIFQSITISMLWRLQVEKWSLWFIFNDMHAPRCSHLHAYTRAQTIYAMERWTGF